MRKRSDGARRRSAETVLSIVTRTCNLCVETIAGNEQQYVRKGRSVDFKPFRNFRIRKSII